MNKKHKFAPFATRPNLNPKKFDPNDQTFVPDRSLNDAKVHDVSVRRVKMIGIKVYDNGGNNTGIADSSDTDVNFDTVEFNHGFITPSGSTFTQIKIPYDGVYLVVGRTEWAVATTQDCRLSITVNNNQQEGETARTNTIKNRRNLALVSVFSAGQKIGLSVRHEDAAAANRDLNTGADKCALTIVYQGAI